MAAQRAVRVDSHGRAHHAQHRQVVDAVGIGGAFFQVEALDGGERGDRVPLAGPVQDVTDEPAGKDAVLFLRDGAQRTRKAEPLGERLADLHGRGGHQPHLLACGDVHGSQVDGVLVGLADHLPVDDLAAQRLQLVDRFPLDQAQRVLAPGGDVLVAFRPAQPKAQLLDQGGEELTRSDEAALGQPLGEQDERGALDERVVHVEEGGGLGILRHVRVGRGDLGCARGGERPADGVDAEGEVVDG